MVPNTLLTYTSISQWLLFLGIALILFGWVEKKEKLVLGGQLIFVFIGLLASWILLTHQITAPEITDGVITKQTKVVGFFRGLIWFSGLSLLILLMKWFRLRYQKAALTVLLLFALMLFFMIYGIQQMAN